MGELECFPRTLLAVRTPQAGGWFLFEESGSRDHVMALARHKWGNDCLIRVLDDKSIGPTGSLGIYAGDHAMLLGWAFDPIAQVWRAPDELFDMTGRAPSLPVDDLSFKIRQIAYGHMELELSAGGRNLTFFADDVDDPFPGFVAWINALREGRPARCMFGSWGAPVLFHVLPASDTQTARLLITDGNAGRVQSAVADWMLLDVVLDTGFLVKAAALLCRHVARHSCFAVHWASFMALDDAIYDAVCDRIEAEAAILFPFPSDKKEAFIIRRQAEDMQLSDDLLSCVARYRDMLETLRTEKLLNPGPQSGSD